MKLLLTSAGIRTQELANTLSGLVGKPLDKINVAVINEASAVEPGDKTWFFSEINDLRKYIGGDIDFIDLLALNIGEVKERVAFADVVYVVGGNPDYLRFVYDKTGFTDLLKNSLLAEKVYVGSSAGSMVMTKRATTKECLDIYSKAKTFDVAEYLGFVDIIFRPHMDSSDNPKYNFDELNQHAKGLESDLYALTNTQALVIVDNNISFVGGDVFTVRKA